MRQTLSQTRRETAEKLDFIDAPINPTTPRLFTVISTFAGGGGSSLGYKWAGGKVLAAVEWDENAVATYRLNHQGTPVLHRDITTVTVEELLELTNLQAGELDIFDGSPPCFPAGFTVITTCGKIPIDFCTVGMEVISHTGKARRITRMMQHTHQGRLYMIETKYGRKPFTCTPGHPIWARHRVDGYVNGNRTKSYSEPEWIIASDLQIGDVICEPHIQGEPSLDILPIITKQRVNIEGVSGSSLSEMQLRTRNCNINWQTNDMAWLLGFYLAEGHVRGHTPTLEDNGPCRREATYSVADKEAPDLAIKLSDAGLHATVQKHSQGSSRVTVASIDFWALCQVMGKHADGKFIPTAFFCMPIEWQECFLDGYLTGDGCIVASKRINSQKRKATTVSWAIALGIAKMIAAVHKVVASIEILYPSGMSQIQGRDVEVKETYSVGYALPTSDRIRPGFVDEYGAWLPIKSISISDPGTTEVYNMEVEEDHSYTIEGFAVHNCQGFSTAGKRQIDDPRNSLFREYVRLLRGLQPKCFIMENVSGMIKGQMKHVFAIAMRELKASGYQVKCQVLDAAYFGVPQHRKRVIFIGVRNDLGIVPSHPKARNHTISVIEAIGHLPVLGPEKHEAQIIQAWYNSPPGQSLRKTNPRVGSFQSVRLNPAKPSGTLVKRHFHWHYAVPRYLTPQESGVIQSFPQNFQWMGSRDDAKERIGNSVPPRFMQAIAEHVYQTILSQVK